MISNFVNLDMDNPTFWSALIIKAEYSVLILCDTSANVCITFGGSDLSIVKNIKAVSDNSELYDVFMRKIGKMCKKKKDPKGHYFSDLDGFVSEQKIKQYVTQNVLSEVNNFR